LVAAAHTSRNLCRHTENLPSWTRYSND
jgi:hypothetical protein